MGRIDEPPTSTTPVTQPITPATPPSTVPTPTVPLSTEGTAGNPPLPPFIKGGGFGHQPQRINTNAIPSFAKGGLGGIYSTHRSTNPPAPHFQRGGTHDAYVAAGPPQPRPPQRPAERHYTFPAQVIRGERWPQPTGSAFADLVDQARRNPGIPVRVVVGISRLPQRFEQYLLPYLDEWMAALRQASGVAPELALVAPSLEWEKPQVILPPTPMDEAGRAAMVGALLKTRRPYAYLTEINDLLSVNGTRAAITPFVAEEASAVPRHTQIVLLDGDDELQKHDHNVHWMTDWGQRLQVPVTLLRDLPHTLRQTPPPQAGPPPAETGTRTLWEHVGRLHDLFATYLRTAPDADKRWSALTGWATSRELLLAQVALAPEALRRNGESVPTDPAALVAAVVADARLPVTMVQSVNISSRVFLAEPCGGQEGPCELLLNSGLLSLGLLAELDTPSGRRAFIRNAAAHYTPESWSPLQADGRAFTAPPVNRFTDRSYFRTEAPDRLAPLDHLFRSAGVTFDDLLDTLFVPELATQFVRRPSANRPIIDARGIDTYLTTASPEQINRLVGHLSELIRRDPIAGVTWYGVCASHAAVRDAELITATLLEVLPPLLHRAESAPLIRMAGPDPVRDAITALHLISAGRLFDEATRAALYERVALTPPLNHDPGNPWWQAFLPTISETTRMAVAQRLLTAAREDAYNPWLLSPLLQTLEVRERVVLLEPFDVGMLPGGLEDGALAAATVARLELAAARQDWTTLVQMLISTEQHPYGTPEYIDQRRRAILVHVEAAVATPIESASAVLFEDIARLGRDMRSTHSSVNPDWQAAVRRVWWKYLAPILRSKLPIAAFPALIEQCDNYQGSTEMMSPMGYEIQWLLRTFVERDAQAHYDYVVATISSHTRSTQLAEQVFADFAGRTIDQPLTQYENGLRYAATAQRDPQKELALRQHLPVCLRWLANRALSDRLRRQVLTRVAALTARTGCSADDLTTLTRLATAADDPLHEALTTVVAHCTSPLETTAPAQPPTANK